VQPPREPEADLLRAQAGGPLRENPGGPHLVRRRLGALQRPARGQLRAPVRAGPASLLAPDGLPARRPAPLRRARRDGRSGAEVGQAGGREDWDDQRLLRRLVRRLHPRPGVRRVGWLRPEPASFGPLRDWWPRGAPHLALVHAPGPTGTAAG